MLTAFIYGFISDPTSAPSTPEGDKKMAASRTPDDNIVDLLSSLESATLFDREEVDPVPVQQAVPFAAMPAVADDPPAAMPAVADDPPAAMPAVADDPPAAPFAAMPAVADDPPAAMNPNVPVHQRDTIPVNYDQSASLRALQDRMNNPNEQWTQTDQTFLNLARVITSYRDEELHPERDKLGMPLCFPSIIRLANVVQSLETRYQQFITNRDAGLLPNDAVEPHRLIRRLPNDEYGRGVFAFTTEDSITAVGKILHIKKLTKAQIENRHSYVTKCRRSFRANWNRETKEVVELNKNVQGFALIVSHTDLAVGGDPRLLTVVDVTRQKGVGKMKSQMTQRELDELQGYYDRLNENNA